MMVVPIQALEMATASPSDHPRRGPHMATGGVRAYTYDGFQTVRAMQPLKIGRSPHTPEDGKSGLRNAHRRSLMRMTFVVTGIVLGIFSVLQFRNGNYPLAIAEVIAVGALILGARKINATRHLRLWIYAFMIPAFAFIIFIMVIPDASSTAFVWVYVIPVVAYLLLGKKEGFMLAAPFLLGATAYNVYHFGSLESAGRAIDLFNPIICGLVLLMFIHVYETMRSQAERQLVLFAETDALTGLPNRSSFQSTLERTINESKRSGNGFALVLMDIDHFKEVNDSLGHDAGDEALQHIAFCLTQRLRSTDFVGRLGGEEFGLILRDVDTCRAFHLADELRLRIADSDFHYGDTSLRLTVTFGLAIWPGDAESLTALYRNADRRLYLGKNNGRNTVVWQDDGPYALDAARCSS